MYPWDSDSQGDYPPEPLRSWKAPAPIETAPAHPVQVALDRRAKSGGTASPAGAAPAAEGCGRRGGCRVPPPPPPPEAPASKVLAWVHEQSGWPSSVATASAPR